MSTVPTADGVPGGDIGAVSQGRGALAPIRLGDVIPPRYRLPDGAPAVLAGVTGQARLKAIDGLTGKSVFIKVAEDGMAIPKEAEVLTRLDHPAIVRLKHWGRGGGAAFLVLDLVDAPDLETVLRQHGGRLSAGEVKCLLAALCPGVEAIHAAGCLHRDLKPANILVPDLAAPIIADFGAAVPMDQAGLDAESWLSQGYAAPEQYRDSRGAGEGAGVGEGPWTDIYGLAAVAYRALSGAPPPPAPARVEGDWMLPAVSAVGDNDLELARAIDRALALDPHQRPRSVADWAGMLGITMGKPSALRPVAKTAASNGGHAAVTGDAGNSGANEKASNDGIPPTVPVRRVGTDRAVVDVSPTPLAAGAPPPMRPKRWWWAALALIGLAFVAAVWAGRPLYERLVKREWIVAVDGSGDTTTIAEAIHRAGDGATILVRPGTYAETVVLNRPLHIAAAPGERPLIAPVDGPCLVARGEGAKLKGFELRGAPHAADPADPAAAMPCVTISSGTIHLEDSRIVGSAGPAVVVRDGARPLIQRNTIAETPGISILVRSGAEPTFLENVVEESGSVVFSEGAKGVFQGNKVLGSRASGLQILTGADPRVSDNAIEASAEAGIFVYDWGHGRIEDNRILGSTLSGVVIAGGGAPNLSANTIAASGEHGILVLDNSGGAIDRNVIKDNKGSGLVLSEQAKVELGANQLEGNSPPQLVDARTR